MTVYKKLQAARLQLVNSGIKKTGHNTYGGWFYYELGDFIPTVHKIFDEIGLCGVVTFEETATLTIHNSDDGSFIEFATPIVYAEAAKGQPIQMLGSTHTYLRRYLWLMAMELVEADVVDAEKQEEKSEPVKVVPKKPPAKIEGKNTDEWKLTITAKENCTTEEWIDLVKSSVAIQLEMASSESDVTNIFRVNREIFDKMKELDADQYQALVNDFKIRKDKFKE
jgi:hypothetical protein